MLCHCPIKLKTSTAVVVILFLLLLMPKSWSPLSPRPPNRITFHNSNFHPNDSCLPHLLLTLLKSPPLLAVTSFPYHSACCQHTCQIMPLFCSDTSTDIFHNFEQMPNTPNLPNLYNLPFELNSYLRHSLSPSWNTPLKPLLAAFSLVPSSGSGLPSKCPPRMIHTLACFDYALQYRFLEETFSDHIYNGANSSFQQAQSCSLVLALVLLHHSSSFYYSHLINDLCQSLGCLQMFEPLLPCRRMAGVHSPTLSRATWLSLGSDVSILCRSLESICGICHILISLLLGAWHLPRE